MARRRRVASAISSETHAKTANRLARGDIPDPATSQAQPAGLRAPSPPALGTAPPPMPAFHQSLPPAPPPPVTAPAPPAPAPLAAPVPATPPAPPVGGGG